MEEMFSTCVPDNNTRNTRNITRKLSYPYRKRMKYKMGYLTEAPLFGTALTLNVN